MLSGCGYHLAGQEGGKGAIPEDVVTVSVYAKERLAQSLSAGLKRQLELNSGYRVVEEKEKVDQQTHADISIEKFSETFASSAYDQTGIASQYRMTIRAKVTIYRDGKIVWDSGMLSVSGDVFVAGGPAGTESSRERLRRDLQKQWIRDASDRINSGF